MSKFRQFFQKIQENTSDVFFIQNHYSLHIFIFPKYKYGTQAFCEKIQAQIQTRWLITETEINLEAAAIKIFAVEI